MFLKTLCAFLFIACFIPKTTAQSDFEERFLEIPDSERVFEYIRDLSGEPCLAGTQGAYDTAVYTVGKLEEFNMPQVEYNNYETLLCYPIRQSLEVLSPTPYVVSLNEPPVTEDPTSNDPRVVPPFLAYAASGNVTGVVIYVNYARPEDFELLISQGVELEGRIALARYGLMFRGLKAQFAREYGMSGLIIFSDPSDDGYIRGEVYPSGPWRPPFGVQRGSMTFINLFSGDPLTPHVAAVPGLPDSEKKYSYPTAPNVPRIPVVTVSYGEAQHILSQLQGTVVTDDNVYNDWQGGLPFSYRIGDFGVPVIASLDVHLEYPVKPIYNVIATIPGTEEPDRQVIIGGHRDGWTFGAGDPHAGSAPLLEVARAFSILLEEGWRPKRTIKIASWDGEEYGLHGSSEFGEEFVESLMGEAVAYINVDGAARGELFRANASPVLGELIRESAAQVVDPDTNETVLEEWERDFGESRVGELGSGSDYTVFLDYLGISSIDFGFYKGGLDANGNLQILPNGVYHSAYDSIYWMENFVPKSAHAKVTQMLGLMALKLVDAEVLPFYYSEYAERLMEYEEALQTFFTENDIPLSLQPFRDAIVLLYETALDVEQEMDIIRENGTAEQKRELNDRLMLTEREFLTLDVNLYKRDEGWYRHTIFAPSYARGYDPIVLPGVTEASADLEIGETEKQLEVLVRCVESAAHVLRGSKKH